MDNTNTNKAKRDGDRPPYRLIYRGFLEDLATALGEGFDKYCESEHDRNYQQGDEVFYREVYDHLIEHLTIYNETGDRYHNGEDHLAHAAANVMMLMWAEDFKKINWPHLEEESGNMTVTVEYAAEDVPFDPTPEEDDHAEELEREEIILKERQLEIPETARNWLKDLIRRKG